MTSCEEEVARIGRKLERMVNGSKSTESAPELLDALSSLPVNFDILTKTRIGLTLNELRKKTTDEKLAKRVKSLIKEWKNLVENKQKSQETKPFPRTESSGSNSNPSNSRDSSEVPSVSKAAATGPPPVVAASFSGSFPPKHLDGDDVRCKSAQMLLSALKSQELPDGTHDPEEMAVKIEQKLFDVHRGTGDKYRAALRSRVFNLRDKKNAALRENVLTGVVSPDKFAVMTTEEMASPEIKQMREKFAKEAIDEHQMSVMQGTPSDMFKCGKCGKKNCTYTQLQTRSSDEPMTTFVFCLECGNRWKFC